MLSSPLLTDFYQLTMVYGFWKRRRAEQRAVYNLFFRTNPFEGGYALVAGLADVLTIVEHARFEDEDLAFLESQRGADDAPLFEPAFMEYLRDLRWSVDIDAMPEGTVAFAPEPLLRVTGPLAQAQLLETALLNVINFQTLIATKAARVCQAAGDDPVLEFGLRRAQGVDGGMAASRAAYIGGCHATSNVLAGQRFGIPVKGTHAHSWVMSFRDEEDAFAAWAKAMPGNCILLVDTYDTLEGVRKAAELGVKLRGQGRSLDGIRLDSGDLAYLSIEARRILDQAGLTSTRIVASSEIDEHLIASLKQQGARIDVWGVGTRLVTGHQQAALGGVYKLAAIERNGAWDPVVKISDSAVKTSTPGRVGVRRYHDQERFIADCIHDLDMPPAQPVEIVDPLDATRRKRIVGSESFGELLVPAVRQGEVVCQRPGLAAIRQRAREELAMLHPTIRRLVNPHSYPAGLERHLYDRKLDLILRTREQTGRGGEQAEGSHADSWNAQKQGEISSDAER
ncbi:MAG: nicotinate phosphoribosyltransferase [Phycisphaeraceae bacterium]|nr:nicotinate phosphoribosyltransferase [Phycisphaeraceae bacterium]